MYYTTEQSKWVAFQYKDPFAADKFFVCNDEVNLCCRPNCDLGFKKYKKQSIKFYLTIDEVRNKKYDFCRYCLPEYQTDPEVLRGETFVSIDLNLLIFTVEDINRQIGFIPPLLIEDDEKANLLKDSISKSNNDVLKKRLLSGCSYKNNNNNNHASSSGSNNLFKSGSPVDDNDENINLTRNEFDHLKLIDLACRHIALAALSTNFGVTVLNEGNGFDYRTTNTDVTDRNEDSEHYPSSTCTSRRGSLVLQQQPMKHKKRRGGVLGFKELAAKSNLSPWHFHRVFKSVTGLTPKNYGDQCWNFVHKNEKDHYASFKCDRSIIINTKIANPTLCVDENLISPVSASAANHTLNSSTANNNKIVTPLVLSSSTPSKSFSFISPNKASSKSPIINDSAQKRSELRRATLSGCDIAKLASFSANYHNDSKNITPSSSSSTSHFLLQTPTITNNTINDEFSDEFYQLYSPTEVTKDTMSSDNKNNYNNYSNYNNNNNNNLDFFASDSLSPTNMNNNNNNAGNNNNSKPMQPVYSLFSNYSISQMIDQGLNQEEDFELNNNNYLLNNNSNNTNNSNISNFNNNNLTDSITSSSSLKSMDDILGLNSLYDQETVTMDANFLKHQLQLQNSLQSKDQAALDDPLINSSNYNYIYNSNNENISNNINPNIEMNHNDIFENLTQTASFSNILEWGE